jgi:hypothetical protein
MYFSGRHSTHKQSSSGAQNAPSCLLCRASSTPAWIAPVQNSCVALTTMVMISRVLCILVQQCYKCPLITIFSFILKGIEQKCLTKFESVQPSSISLHANLQHSIQYQKTEAAECPKRDPRGWLEL